MILVDYHCSTCGSFESMVESPAPDVVACTCGLMASWVPVPISGRVKAGEAVRGKVEEYRPGQLDTRALGEGQPLNEWRAERRKKQRAEHREQIWRETGK